MAIIRGNAARRRAPGSDVDVEDMSGQQVPAVPGLSGDADNLPGDKRRPDSRRVTAADLVACTILVLLAIALRLDFLFASDFRIDADEAIVGLMAKHVAEGSPLPVFYYGQPYMGTLEPYLVSLLFRAFGVSSAALKAVPTAFSLGLVVLTYGLARFLTCRRGAIAAGLLIALPPVPLIEWSTKARGGFIELIVIGGWALLWTFRALDRPRLRSADLVIIGFLCGLGWWVNNQIVFFLPPIAAAVGAKALLAPGGRAAARLSELLRAGIVGTAAFVIGGAPFWIYNLYNDWPSFFLFRGAGGGRTLDYFGQVFSTALPILLGARKFWADGTLYPGATAVSYIVYGLPILVALITIRPGRDGRGGLSTGLRVVLFLLLVSGVAIFSVSSFGYLAQAPRYLLPMYIPIAVLTAVGLRELADTSVRVSVVWLGALLAVNLGSYLYPRRAVPGEPYVFDGQRVQKDHTELLALLDRENIRTVRTNYWIGYRLAFETSERVKFLVFREPEQVRIPSYEDSVPPATRDLVPFLLVPRQAALVEPALTLLGYRFRRDRASGYVLIHGIERGSEEPPPVNRDLYEVSASASGATTPPTQAIDGDPRSRWGTGTAQRPGMVFSVSLSEPQWVSGIKIERGPFWTDCARSLEIVVFDAESDTPRTVLTTDQYRALRYLAAGEPYFEMRFPSSVVQRVELRQMGSDPVFDWSIAEISLLQ